MLRTSSDLSDVKSKIRSFIRERVESSQTDGIVLELGGDVNSAVTAQLCVEALGPRRVIGLIMPDLRLSRDEEVADAKAVAQELCLETREFDIAPVEKAFVKRLEGNRLAEENLRARIRMSLLYYHANVLNRLVSGTADKTEYLLGYFTKYGNGGADILPIADLYRSEVLRLGEVLGVNRRIVAKKGKSRQGGVQAAGPDSEIDYWTADQILRFRFEEGLDVASIADKVGIPSTRVETVLARCEASSHKRRKPDVCPVH